MEKIGTDKQYGEKILDEMDAFSAENAAASASDADDDGLPFESIDCFSTDPVGFEEMAQRMLAKTETVFDLTAVYNRHSKKYLKACAILERGIKYLGSICVTKLALDETKNPCTGLGQLSTMKLYQMASFNYRKLDAALSENLQKCGDLYPELTDMFFRYFSLLLRLRSTEQKIEAYYLKQAHGRDDYGPYHIGRAFTNTEMGSTFNGIKPEPPVFRSAPAFPVIKAMTGDTARVQHPAQLSAGDPEAENSAEPEVISGPESLPGAVTAEADPETAGLIPAPDNSEEADDAIAPEILPKAVIPDEEPKEQAAEQELSPEETEAERLLESNIRWSLSLHPMEGYREMQFRLQDVFFCQDHPDYARIFRKIMSEGKAPPQCWENYDDCR